MAQPFKCFFFWRGDASTTFCAQGDRYVKNGPDQGAEIVKAPGIPTGLVDFQRRWF